MSFIADAFGLAAPQAAIVTKVVEVVAVLGLAGSAVLYLEHRGAAKCERADESAELAQAKRDHQTDQEAIRGLNDRIKQLSGGAPPDASVPPPAGASAPPSLRVRVPANPAAGGSATARSQPGALPNGGCDQRVPGGTESEATIDLGTVVQDFALAGLLNRADSEGLWERAVKESQK